VEQQGVEEFLQELGEVLRAGEYGAQVVRRVYIRWPSRRAMNRVRARIRDLTPRWRCHQDVCDVIAAINPVLRGWGQYFQACNAADHFIDVDDYVVRRLKSLRKKRAGRTCVRVKPSAGTATTSNALACIVCAARSAIPGSLLATGDPRDAASRPTIGKPCAGNPHARFERGCWLCLRPTGLTTSQHLPMPVTYLSVPFREREAVKSLGARWDPAAKRWYVADGRDLAPFSTWLPGEPMSTDVAVRAAARSVGSVVAQKVCPCRNCSPASRRRWPPPTDLASGRCSRSCR
jgi:hypothetical protein